jgi:hypothetical protein
MQTQNLTQLGAAFWITHPRRRSSRMRGLIPVVALLAHAASALPTPFNEINRALFVAAHPDDIATAAGGLVATLVSKYNVSVAYRECSFEPGVRTQANFTASTCATRQAILLFTKSQLDVDLRRRFQNRQYGWPARA